ncbi:MAG: ShlB/FhaC/HecB family hemolysin secretion/activation protein [Parvibaculum sp.]|uniref:ShlB/FhaC/HecB family hemolysin secretion/activation protein n=1 Tax=Parvibaculum sp. TaxID=2024848 RepID=UPI00283ED40C|nr:ShlB/FhaC/HecB family hemolysin secretion/activation protein [Parvibaculum sp.]MDR3499081.1 ShlB/FhaC/HecB family hemolysin secretion/activation protein [Parvibaculum sp.]
MSINKTLLAATSGLVLLAHPALAAPINPLAAPSPGTVLTPPAPSPELPRQEAPRLRENLGLPKGEDKVLNFTFSNIRVVGATAIDEATIAQAFSGLLNKPVTAGELAAAIDRVNKIYDDAGYALGRAFVPAQVMQGGTLIVRVVEGYIGDIKIETDNEAVRASIERFSRRIGDERPLRKATLERYLLLISDIPGVKVGGQLTGMNIYTGAATMELKADYDPLTVDTALDNRANLDGSPFQTYLTGSINDVAGDGEQLSATVLATPNIRDQQYFRLAYSTFVGSDGLRALIGGSFARSKAGDLPANFDLVSRSDEFDASLSYPFIRSLTQNLNGVFGVYAIDAYNDLNGTRFSEDAVRASFLEGSYTARLGERTTFGSNIRLTQGLGLFDAGPDNMQHSRLGARPWFFKARAAASVTYAATDKLSLSASTEGQYSPDSLYSSEEISFGGAHFGRGFDTSEVSGDSGFGNSIQAQYRLDTDIFGGWTMLPYTFLDQSQVYNHAVDQQGNATLVSTGAGITFSNRKWLVVGLEVDKPLNRDVASRGNRDPRLYVSLEVRF